MWVAQELNAVSQDDFTRLRVGCSLLRSLPRCQFPHLLLLSPPVLTQAAFLSFMMLLPLLKHSSLLHGQLCRRVIHFESISVDHETSSIESPIISKVICNSLMTTGVISITITSITHEKFYKKAL